MFSVYNLPDCPEDAILARDLPSSEILDLMERAYLLGKEGRAVKFVHAST